MTNSRESEHATAVKARLGACYAEVNAVILSRQNPITGLLPASTAITAHGDYTDAWVRDNVYSILAVWGLALAYRRDGRRPARTYQLQQSVVRLMRGLLMAMMKQSDKVERFKQTQHPLDALHAKYDTNTGDPVVGDDEWGHLQIDATSLYLLMLAQMTASGLRIIFSLDEVNFIQNLVHYIGRAYRAPDYGIWERGNKLNHGMTELNMSSVGMAKAAMEALDGFNLFGEEGDQGSVIHVIPDEIARTRSTLEYMLPRESGSKEVDAALLSVIGYPAYAVEDPALAGLTRSTIIEKLAGKYGCKRFLRDGHQTVLEDSSRLHYEPTELKQFEHIESEWPLFFTYLVLDGLFRGDTAQVEEFGARLDKLFLDRNGYRLLPELYYVDAAHINAEKANPHSQPRIANENVPLVWAQSLYLLGRMLRDGLLEIDDIDPLQRYRRIAPRERKPVMIAVVAQNQSVRSYLAAHNVRSEVLGELDRIELYQADNLAGAYGQIGRNEKLGLSGRPMRRLRSMATSRVFALVGKRVLFLPQIFNPRDFYLGVDNRLLVERVQTELAYIHRHWNATGRPLMTLLIDPDRIGQGRDTELIRLLRDLQGGLSQGVPVECGALDDLIPQANCERIDHLHDYRLIPVITSMADEAPVLAYDEGSGCRFLSPQELAELENVADARILSRQLANSRNLGEQIDILTQLWRRRGGAFETGLRSGGVCSVSDLTEEIYNKARRAQQWAVVRRAAGLLGKTDDTLEDAVVEILVRQKQLAVGRSYSRDAVISVPMSNADILERIHRFCSDDERERMLHQELVFYLAMLMKAEPSLFADMLTLRVGHMLQLMIARLARSYHWPQHAAFEHLLGLSPHALAEELREVLASYHRVEHSITEVEALHLEHRPGQLIWLRFGTGDDPELGEVEPNWRHWRETQGVVSRLPENFAARVWDLLHHCKGIIIGDRFNPRNVLERELLHGEMTAGERNFALLIEHLLNKIQSPEYRQLVIEALRALAAIFEVNEELELNDYIVLDVVIGYAVRLSWLDMHPQHAADYNEHRGDAWAAFYSEPPHQIGNAFMAALAYLLEQGGAMPEQQTTADGQTVHAMEDLE